MIIVVFWVGYMIDCNHFFTAPKTIAETKERWDVAILDCGCYYYAH
jgi:hypothetical protein